MFLIVVFVNSLNVFVRLEKFIDVPSIYRYNCNNYIFFKKKRGEMFMKKLELIIRPEKLNDLKGILEQYEYSGLTVMSAMGCGQQKGTSNPEFKKLGLEANLLPKLYVMTVVWDEDLEDILATLVERLSTGSVGDGKIFISDMTDVVRIRTGERGKQIL